MPPDLPPGMHVTYTRQYRRCRRPACPSCSGGGPGHGPYWYAYWREHGRVRSRYVGKTLPAEAAQRAADRSEYATEVAQRAAAHGVVTAAPLRVRTLGGFAVWRGDEALDAGAWRRRKVAALFKCILAAPQQRAQRDYLLDTLWPDDDPASAAANLRLTIHRLRRALDAPGAGTSYVRVDGELLALEPYALPGASDWLDAAAFERAAAVALAGGDTVLCRAAVALYTGEYLPDDAYDEWSIERRDALRGQYLAVMLRLAELRAADGAHAEAAGHLRAVLEVEPSHEVAARALMAAYAAAGQLAEALRAYHALAEVLRREVGVEPDAETRALYESLLTAQAGAARKRTNLPAPLTTLLGRGQELEELAVLLASSSSSESGGCRLLTLTGAGGCGKTRLAGELGRELLDTYRDGVWLVELAPLSDPAVVVQDVARVVGALAHAPDASLDDLAGHLRTRHLLLILDNCEHLLDECAQVAASLLRACPALHILATSREALGILGETVRRVPSLSTPDPTRALPPDEVAGFAAVQLFVERARAVQPAFVLNEANGRAVAAICHQLDGIPLAIELAAARLLTLTVDDVAARLSDRFQLLTGGNRAALPRHRALRAVLDWSYALLARPERLLLRRLSIFAGGWSREAAVAVCAGDEVATGEVTPLLERLAAKSLVHVLDAVAGGAEPRRYQLLQTVREYALSREDEGDDRRATHDAHLAWYLSVAERAALEWHGPQRQRFLAELDAEHDNMRAALSWCAGEGADQAAGLRLATALASYWDWRGYLSEGRAWLDRFLPDRPSDELDDEATRLRCTALCRAGSLAYRQADAVTATSLLEDGLTLARRLDDSGLIASCLNNLGVIAKERGEYTWASALFEETLERDRARGDQRGVIVALANLGWVAHARADFASAAALADECLALSRELEDLYYVAHALGHRAHAAYALGEIEQAAALYRETLTLARDLGVRWGLPICLEGLARVAARRGGLACAARWWGAAAALREELGTPLPPDDRAVYGYDRAIDDARGRLGPARFAAEWAAGEALDLEQVIAEALDEGQPA